MNCSNSLLRNVSDPLLSTDGVNLQTLESYTGGGLQLHAWAMWRENAGNLVEIDSENTTSITRNSLGDYYMNFPTAGNTNYIVDITCSSTGNIKAQANEYWDQRTNSRIKVEVHDTGGSPTNIGTGVVTVFIYKRR